MSWGMDASHICLAHQDIKLYGIRSCLVLKEYNVSAAGSDFVNRVLISDNRVFAITNSGLIKIFNYSSQEELISTNTRLPVINVIPIYAARAGNEIHKILVLTAKRVFELSRGGEVDKKYEIEVGELNNSICAGEYLY